MVLVAVSISSAAGPSVAAAILAVASWPWLFAMGVPIGLITLLMSPGLLPFIRPSVHRFDLASAALCAVAFGFLISGINGIGHHHPIFVVIIELIGAALAGSLMVRRQTSLTVPLFPVDLFNRPVFALSVATSVSRFVAQGIVFIAALYLQDAIGRSQVETGLLITVAGNGCFHCTDRRQAGGPLSRWNPGRPRTRRFELRPGFAGLPAGSTRRRRHHLAGGRLRARLWLLPVAQ
jgi:hypothetical protein